MRRVKLGQICEVVSGGTPKTNVEEYWNGEFDWITPAEINDNDYIISDTKRKITQLAIEKKKLTLLPKGTVLLSSRAPIGKVAIAGKEMYCNQGFKNLICSDEICNEYLYWYLKSKKEYLNSLGRGATFKEISKKIVENIEIKLPEIEQQRKIVNKLKEVDKIIQQRKCQSRLLDGMVQSRFVEMFGDLADPKCVWNKVKLINVCKTPNDVKCGPFGTQLNKNEYQKKGVAVWEIPQINDEFTSEPIHFLTEKKAKILESYSVISGDIVMSRKGNIGKCAVFPDEYEKGIIHSDVLRIRVDAEQVNSQFMMRQLHYSRAIKHQIGTVSSGAIMAGINVTKLKQIYVHIPPIDLQNQFAAFVQQVNKSKFVIHKFLYCTTHNTKSIIKPRLNTKESGKIRGGKPHADEF